MSLTKEDLSQVQTILTEVVTEIVPMFKADMDRMESRIVASVNFLERDSFSRLDQHEVRIARLEQTLSK